MSPTRTRLPAPIARTALLIACALVPLSQAATERHALDPAHSVIGFLVAHVGFASVLGRFSDVSGGFDYDEATRTLSDLVITVGTDSISTDDKARDKHVRKADFLDVKRYPQMIFRVDRAVLANDDGGRVDGTLELLGKTLPLALDVTLNKAADYPFGHGKYTYGISARGTLDRSAWGMDYGIANGLVGDEVTLIIETEAPREG